MEKIFLFQFYWTERFSFSLSTVLVVKSHHRCRRHALLRFKRWRKFYDELWSHLGSLFVQRNDFQNQKWKKSFFTRWLFQDSFASSSIFLPRPLQEFNPWARQKEWPMRAVVVAQRAEAVASKTREHVFESSDRIFVESRCHYNQKCLLHLFLFNHMLYLGSILCTLQSIQGIIGIVSFSKVTTYIFT